MKCEHLDHDDHFDRCHDRGIEGLLETEFVQNLTEAQGIATVRAAEPIEDGVFTLCQFYGDNAHCEQGGEGGCSDDGILWGDEDENAAVFCTNHAFPKEIGGYEFYDAREVAAV